MIRRSEMIILPADHAAASHPNRLATILGQTLDAPVSKILTHGQWTVVIVTDGAILPQRHGAVQLVEGAFPDAPGYALAAGRDGWSLSVDHLGLRPIYRRRDVSGSTIISTRPELVAALTGSEMDAHALAELLLVGFTLGHRSLFRHIERIPAGVTLRAGVDTRVSESVAAVSTDEPPSADAMMESVADAIDRGRRFGLTLELSGGVDSRLIYAIARRFDLRPDFAFTLGDEDNEDVTIARAICNIDRLDHLVIAPNADHESLETDARTYVARSGYAVPATTNAWMPRAFGVLSSLRGAQLGGGGGECATGFYDSPLDFLLNSGQGRRSWVRQRLLRRDIDLNHLLVSGAGPEMYDAVVDSAAARLDQHPGSGRQRTAALYRNDRVPNAGGPILSASAAWYHPIQPLLHRTAIAWADALAPADRRYRRAQFELLATIAPDLAALPLSGGRALPSTTLSRGLNTARAVRRRLSAARRHRELGAGHCATRLSAHPSVQRDLERFVGHPALPLRPEALERLIANPGSAPTIIGTLLTASWAERTVRAIRGTFAPSRTTPRPLRFHSPIRRKAA